ncbi:DNA mismatch endonuclease Vsr [Janthinobacterium sp. SUN100]|uniref:very short patch repair endonuclease n=1 Tax=Janthinobacterium sp. SUN100 TaxID=3004101 RepID=UPI0025B1D654|nr:DNA mismatch endonuclease Vsr [Janthinobacterium sp. SUN100]MDN2701219.1 DNA mismatch endonuclease Vsr [Janthinobacterium sp. SUN100]
MTDVHSPERRSRNMRSIRSKNTVPEMMLRKLLFSRGFRFRLHVADMPGKPDIVLPKYRVAVFMHGCFWHGHGCYLFKLPQARREFWAEKIRQNLERDLRAMQQLRVGGWRVLVVWECALKGRLKQAPVALGDQLEAWIRDNSPAPESQFLSVSHIEVAPP